MLSADPCRLIPRRVQSYLTFSNIRGGYKRLDIHGNNGTSPMRDDNCVLHAIMKGGVVNKQAMGAGLDTLEVLFIVAFASSLPSKCIIRYACFSKSKNHSDLQCLILGVHNA